MRSGITRPFDIAYTSNRFILAATPGVGVVAGVVTLALGDGWSAAVRHGFSAGGLAFIAWTIARELHPDRAWPATVAALAAPWSLLRGEPDLLAGAVVMLAARVVAGTTGRWMRWVDVAVVAAVAAPVAVRPTAPGVLTVSAVALGVALVWERRVEVAAMAAIVAGLAVWGWTRFEAAADAWVAVPAALGAVGLIGPKQVAVGTDRPGGVIAGHRVRTARAVALVAALAAAATAPIEAMAPVWVALVAVALRAR